MRRSPTKPHERYAPQQGTYPNVYWIAGGSCSGKSGIADELARRHRLQVLHTDGLEYKRYKCATPERHPAAHSVWPAFEQGFLVWMQIPPSRLGESTYELFELLLDDIRAMGSAPLVVEGMGVNLEAALEVCPRHRLVFLTGTDAFLRAREPEHPFVRQHYATWDRPEETLNGLIEGHIRITHWIIEQACALGIRHIVTDESTSFDHQLSEVEEHFGLR